METLIFLLLCVLACWIGSKLPVPPIDNTAAQIARIIREVASKL